MSPLPCAVVKWHHVGLITLSSQFESGLRYMDGTQLNACSANIKMQRETGRNNQSPASLAQLVEHTLGKGEVMSPNLMGGS